MNIDKMCSELEKMACLEGTEIGEVWQYLAALYSRRDYIDEKLTSELEKAIKEEYKNLKENYKIVEKEKISKHKYLEHK